MRVDAERFVATVQRALVPVYALAGDEPLIVQECLDALRAALRKAGYLERERLVAERDFDWSALDNACATGSLFSERRVVELHLSAPPPAAAAKLLAELIAGVTASVTLVVVGGHLDARARKSAWYAACDLRGIVCYAWPVRMEAFPAWLLLRLRGAGLTATDEAVGLLADYTEGNLLAAAQEVSKLKLLCPDGKVEAGTVLSGVADSARYLVFDWIDRLLTGDRVAAVRGLQRLHEEGTALPPLTAALAADLRQLLALSEGKAAAGVFVRRRARVAAASRRVTASRVRGWIRRLAEIDVLSKSGSDAEAWREMAALALAVAGERGALARTIMAAADRGV
ncbi:MAG TPA: DNA polymerase III subunit delta [Nevskiaceae bacterium]